MKPEGVAQSTKPWYATQPADDVIMGTVDFGRRKSEVRSRTSDSGYGFAA